jgi:hypothetical protein
METLTIVFYLIILFMLSVYGANRYYTIYLFKKHRHDVFTPPEQFIRFSCRYSMKNTWSSGLLIMFQKSDILGN